MVISIEEVRNNYLPGYKLVIKQCSKCAYVSADKNDKNVKCQDDESIKKGWCSIPRTLKQIKADRISRNLSVLGV